MGYKYKVGPSVPAKELREFVQWVNTEFKAVERSMLEQTELDLRTRHQEPTRPRPGMLVYADGSRWDPGLGEGPYFYSEAGLWVPFESAGSISSAITGTQTMTKTNFRKKWPVNPASGAVNITLPDAATVGNGNWIEFFKTDDSANFVNFLSFDLRQTLSEPGPTFALGNTVTLPAGTVATLSGSDVVTITDAGHGMSVGDIVVLTGGGTVAGLVIAGTRTVASVPSRGTWTFTHPSGPAAADAVTTVQATAFYQVVTAARFNYDPFETYWRSGTLPTDPFTATLGSGDLVVTHPVHELVTGDQVVIGPGAALVQGLDPNGTYDVTRLSANTYRITVGGAAAGSGSGGGASVPYEYQYRTVYVQHPAHGQIAGANVTFASAAVFNGVDMNGVFPIATVTSSNAYTVRITGAPTARGFGGGGGVTSSVPIRWRINHTNQQAGGLIGEDRVTRPTNYLSIASVTGTVPGVNDIWQIAGREGGNESGYGTDGKQFLSWDIVGTTGYTPGWTASGGTATMIYPKVQLRVRLDRIRFKSNGSYYIIDDSNENIDYGPRDLLFGTPSKGFTGPILNTQAYFQIDKHYSARGQRSFERSLKIGEMQDPTDTIWLRYMGDMVGDGLYFPKSLKAGYAIGSMYGQGTNELGITESQSTNYAIITTEDFKTGSAGAKIGLGPTLQGDGQSTRMVEIAEEGIALGGNSQNRALVVLYTDNGTQLYWAVILGTRTGEAIYTAGTANPNSAVAIISKGTSSVNIATGGDGEASASRVVVAEFDHVAGGTQRLIFKPGVGDDPSIGSSTAYVSFEDIPKLPRFDAAELSVLLPEYGAICMYEDEGVPVYGDDVDWKRFSDDTAL